MLYTMYTLTNQCRYLEMSSQSISAANSAAAPEKIFDSSTHARTNKQIPF